MLIAGIIGSESKEQTAGLINSILSAKGKKVSVIDSSSLTGLDLRTVKAYISELEKNNVDMLLLKMRICDIDKIFSEEMKPDIVIYTEKADDGAVKNDAGDTGKIESIISLMGEKGTTIVNIDDAGLIDMLQGMKHNFVTYGFNTKASITTSSIGDTLFKDSFICCLQRPIPTRCGNIVEPQEYKLKLEASEVDSHDVLAAATFAIINDIDLNNHQIISKI